MTDEQFEFLGVRMSRVADGEWVGYRGAARLRMYAPPATPVAAPRGYSVAIDSGSGSQNAIHFAGETLDELAARLRASRKFWTVALPMLGALTVVEAVQSKRMVGAWGVVLRTEPGRWECTGGSVRLSAVKDGDSWSLMIGIGTANAVEFKGPHLRDLCAIACAAGEPVCEAVRDDD